MDLREAMLAANIPSNLPPMSSRPDPIAIATQEFFDSIKPWHKRRSHRIKPSENGKYAKHGIIPPNRNTGS